MSLPLGTWVGLWSDFVTFPGYMYLLFTILVPICSLYAFNHGLHCFLRQNRSSEKETQYLLLFFCFFYLFFIFIFFFFFWGGGGGGGGIITCVVSMYLTCTDAWPRGGLEAWASTSYGPRCEKP